MSPFNDFEIGSLDDAATSVQAFSAALASLRDTLLSLMEPLSAALKPFAEAQQQSVQDLEAYHQQRLAITAAGLNQETEVANRAATSQQAIWRRFMEFAGKGVTELGSLWSQFWENMVASDWDGMLAGFLNSLASMAAQLGSFLLLAGTGLSFIPGFQQSAGAVAAGAGLLALAGVLRGLSELSGRDGDGGISSGGACGGSGGGSGATLTGITDEDAAGRTVIINIEGGSNLDTAETIARRVAEVMKVGRSMGYRYE